MTASETSLQKHGGNSRPTDLAHYGARQITVPSYDDPRLYAGGRIDFLPEWWHPLLLGTAMTEIYFHGRGVALPHLKPFERYGIHEITFNLWVSRPSSGSSLC